MFKNNFMINPKRIETKISIKTILKSLLQLPLIKFLQWLGFENIEYSYVHGSKSRVHLGKNCSTMNSIFNVISGEIFIGDNTLLGHNCMVLTGTHKFYNGIRGNLCNPPQIETPSEGRDIRIGSGCFIGSGVIIMGPINIGNNVIIGSGSVVIKDIPDFSFAAGNPAEVKKKLIN